MLGLRIFCLLSLIHGNAPSPPEVITGFYYSDSATKPEEIAKPAAGALIGLYDAGNNLMVDYTYSTDSGRFTLKAPDHSGRFYVVATKDNLSTRRDFEWSPQETILIMIRRTKPTFSVSAVAAWIWSKFDYVITSFIGFVLALAYKWYQDRKKARKSVTIQAAGIRASVGKVIGLYESFAQCLQEYDKSSGGQTDAIGKRCRTILEEIGEGLGEVSALAEKTDVEILYDAYKARGTNSYGEFREALKGAKSFVESDLDSVLSLQAEQRVELTRPFETLKNCAFLKY